MHTKIGKLIGLALMLGFALAGCGESAPGPDVRGMALPEAEKALTDAHMGYSEHPQNGSLLGILVKANWVVCSEGRVNDHMVRLDVSKQACQE
jgi:hypothetical protein